MKQVNLIFSLMLLFGVYAAMMEVSMKKIFFEKYSTEFIDAELDGNDSDSDEQEESDDDEFKAVSFVCNVIELCHLQRKTKVFSVNSKLVLPDISVDSPPPKNI